MSEENVEYIKLVRRDQVEALTDALFRLGQIKAVAITALEKPPVEKFGLFSRPLAQALRDIVALVDGKGGGE